MHGRKKHQISNQRIEQFSKLKFNCCFLLHVSNLVGSSSGREPYMQYGTFYMHRCEQSGVPDPKTLTETYRTAHTTVSLAMNPRGSKHVGENRY